MQLLIILALLLYGGRGDSSKLLSEMEPVLESIGGEEVKAAFKSAEEIKEVISAINGAAPSAESPNHETENISREKDEKNFEENFYNPESTNHTCMSESSSEQSGGRDEKAEIFPLASVFKLADKDIAYCLAKYLAEEC